MLMVTTDTLPEGIELKECYGLVLVNYPVEVSSKGILRGILERDRNEYNDALNMLKMAAPSGANILYGVNVSTSVGQFNNGAFLYLTMTATAGFCEGL